MAAWVEVACEVADVIRQSEHARPTAGRTDLDGQWGEPCIYTEWGLDHETPVLREWRYPAPDGSRPDPKPCRHEVPSDTRHEGTSGGGR